MNDLLHILADWNRWWETGEVSPEVVGKREMGKCEVIFERALSFKEVLSFSKIEIKDISLISQETRNLINGVLLRYLTNGGFPEIVFRKENMKRRLLSRYFQNIVYKNIVNRYGCIQEK